VTTAVESEVREGAGRSRDAARSWRTLHLSVQGATHIRRDVICQDSSGSGVLDRGRWAYVVVADGHGSRPYFRSDRGARFAVETLVEQFRRFHTYAGEAGTPRAMDDWTADAPRGIVASWRAKVVEDLSSDPPSVSAQTAEHVSVRGFLDDVRETHGYGQLLHSVLGRMLGRDEHDGAVDTGPVPWEMRAYGTTLLGVLVGPDCLFWVQMGDGAMVKIVGGEAVYLVPPPPEAMANQTPSLCDDDAVHRIHAGAERLAPGGVPSTLVLATDGVPNSYETENGFFQFCRDIAQHVGDTADLLDKLQRWLPEISRKGSGDDMSVALAWASEEAVAGTLHGRAVSDEAATPPLGVPVVDPVDGDNPEAGQPDPEDGPADLSQSADGLPPSDATPGAARPDAFPEASPDEAG
jgi:Protein phosphatase 2C